MAFDNKRQPVTLQVLIEEPSGDAAADLDRGVELLREVRAGQRPPLLRIYRPDPTLAFGQRDVRLEGYEQAVRSSERHGFFPLVRKAGGRAAAYHRGTLIVDHIEPHPDAMIGHQDRFVRFGQLYARALQRVGVDAHVGELDGEYCAGEHSVHGVPGPESVTGVPVKLVGTAQRVIAGAWLFSSVFVISDSPPIRKVLDEVYRLMGIPMDPATAGAADDLVQGLTPETFIEALLDEYAAEYGLER
ncbi:lipoate--protein ligase family protein [Glutamicibacter sp. MNS18]|uniref:lipoate--protein ligase family protein n=1 Tax=Glutamicibacter sp. MNS18 TaxID=2989817 RepID=UPI00223612CC|nr:lipoate--protein ligase family protein [Glutamicibacter sp. MNS18]MCW4464720.1 lipoate--protein ligase family protein [Glutamicibacter sp. MNS18]